MIKVEQVTKKIGQAQILSEIDLEIPKQQITSFIGPNGAGKSTLLGIISRLDSSFTGNVTVNGLNVHTADPQLIAKTLSILKQSNHINLRLTVQDLVAFGRFPHTQGKLTAECKRIIARSIDYMGLTEMAGKFIDELSGGQRQRAYIAMILAQDTEYIFLDEPLNNLDMKHSVQIMQVLRDLVDNHGKTVIIVLHDINFASAYSDYIVALKDGKLCVEGKVEDVMNTPTLTHLYDFEIPIHQVDGQLIATYFKKAEGAIFSPCCGACPVQTISEQAAPTAATALTGQNFPRTQVKAAE